MTSPLYPLITKLIGDEWVRLERNQITPWAFLTAGPPFRIKDFYGKQISYQGIGFEGSPSQVFWGRYIEPFLEDSVDRLVKETLRLCEEKREKPNEPLTELGGLLKSLAHRAYDRMVEIDQRLRGRGYPESVGRRRTDREFKRMEEFIDQRISAEQAMVKPRLRINEFYNEHPFLFWLIALIVSAAIGLIAS
jgi:hypothetical protein